MNWIKRSCAIRVKQRRCSSGKFCFYNASLNSMFFLMIKFFINAEVERQVILVFSQIVGLKQSCSQGKSRVFLHFYFKIFYAFLLTSRTISNTSYASYLNSKLVQGSFFKCNFVILRMMEFQYGNEDKQYYEELLGPFIEWVNGAF